MSRASGASETVVPGAISVNGWSTGVVVPLVERTSAAPVWASARAVAPIAVARVTQPSLPTAGASNRCAGRDRLAADPCRAHARSAEILETFVWDTVVAVLRDPEVLTEKLEAHRARLGAHKVEVRSEIEHLTRQMAEADRQEQKLLDLFLDEQLDSPAVRGRLADLRRRKTGLEERLARARTHAATQEAESAHQDAIRQYCHVISSKDLTHCRQRAVSGSYARFWIRSSSGERRSSYTVSCQVGGCHRTRKVLSRASGCCDRPPQTLFLDDPARRQAGVRLQGQPVRSGLSPNLPSVSRTP